MQQQQQQQQEEVEEERTIDLSSLSVQQLLQVRKQIEADCKTLANNVRTLKIAWERYSASLEAVKAMDKPTPQPLLVPLSSSMYMPGKTVPNGKVMIDLGTGFYAKMPIAQAEAVLQRKIDYVTKNVNAFEKNFDDQKEMLQRVVDVTQRRVQQEAASRGTATLT